MGYPSNCESFFLVTDTCTAVSTAIEELAADIPEELASGGMYPFHMSHSPSNPGTPDSDVISPEEWEDNSMIASDSEMGLAGSP